MMWWMIQARASPELHLAQDPLAQDPLAQDPLAQDHPLIHHQALSNLVHAFAPPAKHAVGHHHQAGETALLRQICERFII